MKREARQAPTARRLAVAAAAICLACGLSGEGVQASDFLILGPTSDPGPILGGGFDECGGTLAYNHNNTFEGGYGWYYGGVYPPYYGSFAEGYLLDAASIECIVLWLTDVGYYYGGPCDVYIWEGGVSSEPGAVLHVTYGIDPGAPAFWPSFSQHDIDIVDYAFAGGELTVGYWGDWPGQGLHWFCASDLDGPGGHPWTCLAPGSGYGTGWADPSIVWGSTQSMGLGFYYDESPTPVHGATWGAVKRLFQ